MQLRLFGAVVFVVAIGACHDAELDQATDMLRDIARTTQFSAEYTGIEAIDPVVMGAMSRVDRARFVPEEQRRFAFANQPLAIGHGQTISQPFIVALMTHVLQLESSDRVLEIGTGSGYQAAILSELAEAVCTIEIVEPLARNADALLKELGYENVSVRVGDGWFGWPEQAPFDKIMVTAVAPKLPDLLIEQLKTGGRLVLPVGDYDGYQELVLIEKHADDGFERTVLLPVRFVPMTGEAELFD